jgi:hypothetical protein
MQGFAAVRPAGRDGSRAPRRQLSCRRTIAACVVLREAVLVVWRASSCVVLAMAPRFNESYGAILSQLLLVFLVAFVCSLCVSVHRKHGSPFEWAAGAEQGQAEGEEQHASIAKKNT